jgi:hypothetical protein
MPYTLVHPGFAAWIKSKWLPGLSWNGLIFGSLVPDFDILFRLSNARFHLINGGILSVLFILLPVAILISWLFHTIVRNKIIDFLPNRFFPLLQPYTSFNYVAFLKKNFVLEIFTIILAIELHYLLDFVSHWNAWYCMMAFHVLIYPSVLLKPFVYYFAWYLPMVVATALGCYLVYTQFIKKVFEESNFKLVTIEWPLKTRLFIVLFVANTVSFSILKFIFLGHEGNGLAWHYIIIYATSGAFFALFTTPVLMSGITQLYSKIIKK